MSFVAQLLFGRPARFPNPLIAKNPDFADQCDAHRDTCERRVKRWIDLFGDPPGLSTDPAEREAAVLGSCLRVYAVLAKPDWDEADVTQFAEHYPVALECPAFRTVMAGRLLQTELALRAARQFWTYTRTPA